MDYRQKHHRPDRPVYGLRQNNRLIKSFPAHKRPPQPPFGLLLWPPAISFFQLSVATFWPIFVTLAGGHYCLTGFSGIITNDAEKFKLMTLVFTPFSYLSFLIVGYCFRFCSNPYLCSPDNIPIMWSHVQESGTSVIAIGEQHLHHCHHHSRVW